MANDGLNVAFELGAPFVGGADCACVYRPLLQVRADDSPGPVVAAAWQPCDDCRAQFNESLGATAPGVDWPNAVRAGEWLADVNFEQGIPPGAEELAASLGLSEADAVKLAEALADLAADVANSGHTRGRAALRRDSLEGWGVAARRRLARRRPAGGCRGGRP